MQVRPSLYCSSLAAGIRGGCFKTAMARLQVRINNLLFSTLMKQEVAFYDATRTGEITSRLTSDTTTMTEALSLNVNIFLRSVVQASKYYPTLRNILLIEYLDKSMTDLGRKI